MIEATVDSPITSLNGFKAERERWERLYRADRHSHVFLSWSWLFAYLSTAPAGWTVLALRDGDELVAALPLRTSAVPSPLVPIASQLSFASTPFGDYQGMLCRAEREHDAPRAFARAMLALRWDRAWFPDVVDARFMRLLDALGGDVARVELTGTTRSPRVDLPATWDAFAKTLGPGTRATTTRSVPRLEREVAGFRVSSPADGDVDAHVEAMVHLRHLRWGGNLTRARATYGRLYRAAYDAGCARIIVMWDGAKPIAGATAFVDGVHGTYSLYQLSYDKAYARYSPGKGAAGLAIRDAIANGYRVFDFLRGDEPYKALYAPDAWTTSHHRVARGGLRSSLFDAINPAYRTLKGAAARVVYGPGRRI